VVSWLGVGILGVAFAVLDATADSVGVNPNSGVGNTPITVTASGFDETGNMAVFFYLDTPSSFEQPGYWGVCFGSGSCQIQTRMPFAAGSHTVYAYGYANADPDGDGQNNMAEFLAGTDPTDSASAFRILEVTRTNGDVRISWFTHAGLTNVLQAATDPTGNYTNISPNLIIIGTTNSDDVVTNYVEVGATTNFPSRYYRVRLVP
jgi:hypothetical protein